MNAYLILVVVGFIIIGVGIVGYYQSMVIKEMTTNRMIYVSYRVGKDNTYLGDCAHNPSISSLWIAGRRKDATLWSIAICKNCGKEISSKNGRWEELKRR
ncbi:hypothetical protein FJZ33_02735 [Candidatus Poribacteria bacterium]|nr:hypothetical protein [Candidatus Poribacteria bacterium]